MTDVKAIVAVSKYIEELFEPLCCEPREFPTCKFGGYSYPPSFPTHWKRIHETTISEGDIAVVSHPKAGTTWVQLITFLVQTEDFEVANKTPLEKIYHFIEWPCLLNTPVEISDLLASKVPPVPGGPKFFKSHLPPKFLPRDIGNAKIIFVYRNAKDTAVSYFYHYKSFKCGYYPRFTGSFEDFARAFMNGLPLCLPYGKLIADYFELKMSAVVPKLLILRYEDIKTNHKGAIRKIAAFLGKELSEERLEKIYQATTFESMRGNAAVNRRYLTNVGLRNDTNFIRKGVIGDWKNHFLNSNLVKEFNESIRRDIPEELYHILD